MQNEHQLNEQYKYWGIDSEKDEEDSQNVRERLLKQILAFSIEGKSDSVICGALLGSVGALYGNAIHNNPELQQELQQDLVDCITYHCQESFRLFSNSSYSINSKRQINDYNCKHKPSKDDFYKSYRIDKTLYGLVEDSTDHLHAALILMQAPIFSEAKDPACFDSTVGFLLHLATELLLKALLYERTGTFPKKHNLETLLDALSKADNSIQLINHDEFIKKIKDYDQLRYRKTDRKFEGALVELQEIESFWTKMLLGGANVKKIITSINTKEKYGFSFQPYEYLISTTINVRCQKDVDGNYIFFEEKLTEDKMCPICESAGILPS